MKGSRSKKIIQIVIPVVVVVLILPLTLGYIWFYNMTRAPLPQHSGELQVAGLQDTVEILRDEWGVPHVYASNMHDLFFAQGYTQAQDRWWQMEFCVMLVVAESSNWSAKKIPCWAQISLSELLVGGVWPRMR